MMPVRIRGANLTLTKPANWDEEHDGKCFDISARHEPPHISTAWRPSAEELAALNAGGVVVMRTFSSRVPPAMLLVEDGHD